MENIVIHPLITAPCTQLYVGEDLLSEDLLTNLCLKLKGRVVIIVDHTLKDLYGTPLVTRLESSLPKVNLLTIPNGEKAKNKATVEYIQEELFKMECGRDTILIALGGGVTTDVVGFVASIYLRGIPLILIPTTLLALVDASIGGKTGIDTPFGKNLIGAIYHPKAIFADLTMLQTLPDKEWLNGLAEILKMGLIFNTSIWELAKKNIKNQELILKAIQGKISIIEQDPSEQGLRRILNFGHTIGHALEKLASYEMAHGEAVAIGCLVEAHLSMELKYLSENDFKEIQIPYKSFSLKLPKSYNRQNLFKAMSHDKKNAMGKTRFVLIDRIGHTLPFDGEYCREISKQELENTLDWMERHYG